MKGKVTKFDETRKAAEIVVEGKDSVFLADKQKLTDAGIETLNVGDIIFFEIGNPQGRNRVRVRKILAEDISNNEDIFEKVNLPERPERLYLDNNQPFSNPYSFVSVVKVLEDKFNLFRKPFVPHDKFQGLSGEINCRLKTLTPFFTSGTHKEEERGTHKKLDFFSIDKEKINGQENKWRMPIVSGSTLRGVIRSVCEAVSNSSFTALSSETLDYRCSPSQSRFLKCGIVIKTANNSEVGEIRELNKAKLPYLPDEANVIPNTAKDTKEGWALVEDENRFVKVVKEAETENPDDTDYEKGYFKLTGKNIIENKENERFFFEDTELDSTFTFSLDEQQKYNDVIGNQNKNAQKTFESDSSDIAVQQISQRKNHPLSAGHLVYFQEDGGSAKNLGYVSIPRWQYEKAIYEKIDVSFHPAEDAESLCPTSRIFGFVRDKKISKKKDNEGKSSYAGRVYFSDAKFDLSDGKKVRYDENIVLDILGSPKPTTYEFYLSNPNNKSQTGNYNNANMKLRGRKFYLHQKNEGQYKRKFDTDEKKHKTSQNSTLNRVLAEGNEFVFTVRFENLEEYELGLLLWSLALEKGMAHKIGMGKPLGLGSVSIEVESVEIIKRDIRYSSFFQDDNSFQEGKEVEQIDYVSKFTDWIESVFCEKPKNSEDKSKTKEFKDLENVKDLKKILEYPNSLTKPIHYPLCKNTDEKHFEWFVANRHSKNQHQILPYPNKTNNVSEFLERNEKPR